MAAGEHRLAEASALAPDEALVAIAEVVEAGDGLPSLARAIGRALEASVAILDRSSSVLAVACASPEDERAVLGAREGVERVDLVVGGANLGELRIRGRGNRTPPQGLTRTLAALVALELDRTAPPGRATGAAR